jgi:hypothetical protein
VRRRTWIGLGAVALAVLALSAGGVALAQEDDTDRPSFIDRVAAKLGIDTPQLEDAVDSAAADMLDEAVADGRISPERAERLKEQIEETEGFPHLGGRWHGPGFGMKFGLGIGFGGLGDIAEFIGVTPAQLREELAAEDATLGSVAEAHGKSRDDLHAFIVSAATERIDQAVADGKLTQERADAMKERLDEMADRVIDSNLCAGGRFDVPSEGDAPEGLLPQGGRFFSRPGA